MNDYTAFNPSRETHFWERVSKLSLHECWEWTAGIDGSGYGVMWVDETFKCRKAHRFSYELHFGPIPPKILCLHDCDNPRCVNPFHLWLGTQLENVKDMHTKGRANLTSRPRGEVNTHAKLTAEQVLYIRKRYAEGQSVSSLAKDFNFSRSGIHHIISRRHWKHI